MAYKINYIITIHNKEHLIERVLNGIKDCCGSDSTIYPVLDGCTDGTEQIIDEFSALNSHLSIIKLYADDVHELGAINVALKEIEHSSGDYLNMILQDDVVLNEPKLEAYLNQLYHKFDSKLGVVSLRHGGNLSKILLSKSRCLFPIRDYIETQFGHGVSNNLRNLGDGEFVFRDVAIKSPICIPSYVLKTVGIPDEAYKPWDDIAYCFSVQSSGYLNGVLSVCFLSDKEWGTMRNKKQQIKHNDILQRNLGTFRNVNKGVLSLYFANRKLNHKVYKIWKSSYRSNGLLYNNVLLIGYRRIRQIIYYFKLLAIKNNSLNK